jgi:Flp pilus assembly pilin Flp
MSIPSARCLTSLFTRFVHDEEGDDLVEYAILTAMIGLAGYLVFPALLSTMGVAYGNWDSKQQDIWEPCPPLPATC